MTDDRPPHPRRVRPPKSGRTRDQSTDPVNVNKAKALDISLPDHLAVRRFSWEGV